MNAEQYDGVIDVIEAFDLDFRLGNAVKYILRARKKGQFEVDLEKAAWYLRRAISRHVESTPQRGGDKK